MVNGNKQFGGGKNKNYYRYSRIFPQ